MMPCRFVYRVQKYQKKKFRSHLNILRARKMTKKNPCSGPKNVRYHSTKSACHDGTSAVLILPIVSTVSYITMGEIF
jgi:hypothetical protein